MAARLEGNIHCRPCRGLSTRSERIPLGMETAIPVMPSLSQHSAVPDYHSPYHRIGSHMTASPFRQSEGQLHKFYVFVVTHNKKPEYLLGTQGSLSFLTTVWSGAADTASGHNLSSIRTVTVGIGISPIQSLSIRESRTVTAGRESHPALRDILIRVANIGIFYKLCTLL